MGAGWVVDFEDDRLFLDWALAGGNLRRYSGISEAHSLGFI